MDVMDDGGGNVNLCMGVCLIMRKCFVMMAILLIILSVSISACTSSNNIEISNIHFKHNNNDSTLSFTVTNKGSSTLRGPSGLDIYAMYYARIYDKNGNFMVKSSPFPRDSFNGLEPRESREISLWFPFEHEKFIASLPNIGKIEIVEETMNNNGGSERVITYNY